MFDVGDKIEFCGDEYEILYSNDLYGTIVEKFYWEIGGEQCQKR